MKVYDKIEGFKEGEVSNVGWIRYFKDYGRTSFYKHILVQVLNGI